MQCQALRIISKPSVILNWSNNPTTLNLGQNRRYFALYELDILFYFKLCVPFHSYRSIQTGVPLQKRQSQVKIDDFFVSCDLEI